MPRRNDEYEESRKDLIVAAAIRAARMKHESVWAPSRFWGPSPPSQPGRESTTCPARRPIAPRDIN